MCIRDRDQRQSDPRLSRRVAISAGVHPRTFAEEGQQAPAALVGLCFRLLVPCAVSVQDTMWRMLVQIAEVTIAQTPRAGAQQEGYK
eukprot:3233021-Rhodomonas_salina.1